MQSLLEEERNAEAQWKKEEEERKQREQEAQKKREEEEAERKQKELERKQKLEDDRKKMEDEKQRLLAELKKQEAEEALRRETEFKKQQETIKKNRVVIVLEQAIKHREAEAITNALPAAETFDDLAYLVTQAKDLLVLLKQEESFRNQLKAAIKEGTSSALSTSIQAAEQSGMDLNPELETAKQALQTLQSEQEAIENLQQRLSDAIASLHRASVTSVMQQCKPYANQLQDVIAKAQELLGAQDAALKEAQSVINDSNPAILSSFLQANATILHGDELKSIKQKWSNKRLDEFCDRLRQAIKQEAESSTLLNEYASNVQAGVYSPNSTVLALLQEAQELENGKKIATSDLNGAIVSRVQSSLKSAIANANKYTTLTPLVSQAQQVLQQVVEEERMTQLLKSAIQSADKAVLQKAIQQAEQSGIAALASLIEEAKLLLGSIIRAEEEQKRIAEEQKQRELDEQKRIAQKKKLEEAKRQEELRLQEEANKLEAVKQEMAKQEALQKQIEEVKQKEALKKQQQEQRLAEQKKQDEEAKQQQALKQQQELQKQQALKQQLEEQQRIAEQKRKDDEAKKQLELKKQQELKQQLEEQQRVAEQAKKQQEMQKQAELKKQLDEQQRVAEQKKKDEDAKRQLEIQKQAELKKQLEEQQRIAEQKKKDEQKKLDEQKKQQAASVASTPKVATPPSAPTLGKPPAKTTPAKKPDPQTVTKEWAKGCVAHAQKYGVAVNDFSKSFRDGRAFLAIIYNFRPDLIPNFDTLMQDKTSDKFDERNIGLAFSVAEGLGVERILDVEDMLIPSPEPKTTWMYVNKMMNVMGKMKSAGAMQDSMEALLAEAEQKRKAKLNAQ